MEGEKKGRTEGNRDKKDKEIDRKKTKKQTRREGMGEMKRMRNRSGERARRIKSIMMMR